MEHGCRCALLQQTRSMQTALLGSLLHLRNAQPSWEEGQRMVETGSDGCVAHLDKGLLHLEWAGRMFSRSPAVATRTLTVVQPCGDQTQCLLHRATRGVHSFHLASHAAHPGSCRPRPPRRRLSSPVVVAESGCRALRCTACSHHLVLPRKEQWMRSPPSAMQRPCTTTAQPSAMHMQQQ